MLISKAIWLIKQLATILMCRLEIIEIQIKYQCKTKCPIPMICKCLKKGSCKQKPCFFASMVGKNLKEPLQVIYVLNAELINLFVHQHQPEIAFNCKSLMEYQQSIGSQHTNNNQQQQTYIMTVFSAFIVYLVLRNKKCSHVITFLQNIFFLLFGISFVVNICNIIG